MKSVRRVSVILLVFSLLLLACTVAAFAEGTFILPASLKVIQAEAFYGDASLSKVVLPDGIKRIESRTFAKSTLTEINLPDSLEYIADDAFDGPVRVSISVNEDTYAYQWAVENDYFYASTSPFDFTYTPIDDTYCAITGYTGKETALILPVWTPDGTKVQKLRTVLLPINHLL